MPLRLGHERWMQHRRELTYKIHEHWLMNAFLEGGESLMLIVDPPNGVENPKTWVHKRGHDEPDDIHIILCAHSIYKVLKKYLWENGHTMP